ncbi:MAG: LysR family transcriptional regulator [Erysipelotrichaceae bacterium]|nr:LysR family transcriptional regulator [Erysipelotrichaceae bacterium]
MNKDNLHVFLTIVRYGSISSAAKRLFTSQSNLSAKLQNLEEEVGHPLIIRGRGRKTIELTAHGDKLLDIARRMESLDSELDELKKDSGRQTLSIGLIEALCTVTLLPFLKEFMLKHPEICLTLHTYHSREVCSMAENRMIDLGLAGRSSVSGAVRSEYLLFEPMTVLVHRDSDYQDGVSLSDLPAEGEIYVRWSSAFENWHNEIWQPGQFQIQVSTSSMVGDYICSTGNWAIVGKSTALRMTERYPLRMISCREELPVRAFYIMENRYPRPSRMSAMDLFKQELQDWISGSRILLDGRSHPSGRII